MNNNKRNIKNNKSFTNQKKNKFIKNKFNKSNKY